MKARIGIMSEELIRVRMLAIASGRYKPEPDEPKVWYTSLAAIAQTLRPENIELLRLIDRERPESLSELSKLTGRATSNLSNTLHKLESKGFLRLEKKSHRKVKPVALFTDFEIITGEELTARFCALKAA